MTAAQPLRTLAGEGAPRGGLPALCITQTTAWGVLYYALLPADRAGRGAVPAGVYGHDPLVRPRPGEPLTTLTLVPGFASTIFAPLNAVLTSGLGWRAAFLVLAEILAARGRRRIGRETPHG